MIDVICPFATASAVHILDHDGWISGNMFFQKGNCGFYPKISASARRVERDNRDGLTFIEIGLGKREVGRKNQDCGQNRTGCKIYSKSTYFHVKPPSPLMYCLPRWDWSWAGKLFIKLHGLRIPRQIANRLLICFRRQW